MYETQLLGITLFTDSEELYRILVNQSEILNPDLASRIDTKFPGLTIAAIELMKELYVKRLPVGLILYMNYRLQVWAGNQFNADPSNVRFIPQIDKEYGSQQKEMLA